MGTERNHSLAFTGTIKQWPRSWMYSILRDMAIARKSERRASRPPFLSLPSPLPFHSFPLNPSKGLGECCKLPGRSRWNSLLCNIYCKSVHIGQHFSGRGGHLVCVFKWNFTTNAFVQSVISCDYFMFLISLSVQLRDGDSFPWSPPRSGMYCHLYPD